MILKLNGGQECGGGGAGGVAAVGGGGGGGYGCGELDLLEKFDVKAPAEDVKSTSSVRIT